MSTLWICVAGWGLELFCLVRIMRPGGGSGPRGGPVRDRRRGRRGRWGVVSASGGVGELGGALVGDAHDVSDVAQGQAFLTQGAGCGAGFGCGACRGVCGLLACLGGGLGVDGVGLGQDGIGPLLESFVVGELVSQAGWAQESYRVFHYRDRNGKEVDAVIELDDGRVLGIEVKASSTFRAEHFAGLAFLMDKLGDRFVAGVVLGTSDRGYQYADRLWGLPVSSLWEV